MTSVLAMNLNGGLSGKGGFRADDAIDRNKRSDIGRASECHVAPSQSELVAILQGFPKISLEETNKSASMLKRIDNKYIVDQQQLRSVLELLRNNFKVLAIDGCRIFSYESCYFDDDGRCFNEHQQGRRQRFKVRTRRYVESNMAFFEVKLKGRRGQTDKSRKACDHYHSFVMNESEQRMLSDLYEHNYGRAFHYKMVPALHVSYQRFTLVSASGRERITVDLNLGFETPSGKCAFIGDDFIIIETKTADGRGKSDRALKNRHIRSVAGCSKYCVGMALTGAVTTYGKFRPIVKLAQSRMLTQVGSRMVEGAFDDPGVMRDGIIRCSK